MKTEISSIELRHIVSEMQFLLGARLDKAVQSEREMFFQFYVTSRGNFSIRTIPGKFFYITKMRIPQHETHNFVMRLRKHIQFFFVKSIRQTGSERIVEIVLEKNEDSYKIYIELFGKGNMILCDKGNKLIAALDRLKDQENGKDFIYEPPKKGKNLFEIDSSGFNEIKNSKQESLVKALAIDFGTGGVFAEEICVVSGIDKKINPKELSEEEIKALFNSLQDVLSRKTEPLVVYKDDEPFNAVPFRLSIYAGLRSEKTETFSDGLDIVVKAYLHGEKKGSVMGDIEGKSIKIQRIIDEQSKGLIEIQKEVDDNKLKAEKIYENYALVKEILDGVNKARAKYSWKEIKEKLKGHKMIKSVNEKEKRIVVEM